MNALVYSMGDEADDILSTFHLSAADSKKYSVVKGRFNEYFVQRRNTIFERARFNQRTQESEEPVDAFITALHGLAEHCGYGALRDEMIRDRIVVGLRDARLSEKLQMDPELTLEKAVSAARQSEAVKKQQAVVRGQPQEALSSSIDRVERQTTRFTRKPWQDKPPNKSLYTQQQSTNNCTWCGKFPSHSRHLCPAREAVCHKCRKKGHFKAVCRSAYNVSVVTVAEEDSSDSDAFLGTVSGTGSSKPWQITMLLNNSPLEFRIDTGADVTVIPESKYDGTRDGPLRTPERVLSGPSQRPLQVRGQISAYLRHGGAEATEEVYVVKGLKTALLGSPAIDALNIISRVRLVEADHKEIVDKFPQLFRGLGKMQCTYNIKLKPGSKPFALFTPRRIAIPLRPRVKEELQRMERLGVIEKVDKPTEWCAGIVVVPKPSGKVRICVDLTRLNESVCREHHLLPTVEEALAQIGGAKVFSKLDANSGFWQIELSNNSAPFTTFITPFGRFCFKRLPFGITSAPEFFQKKMSELLTGLEGVVCLMDDVLVGGKTQQEHNDRLEAVLNRMRAAGLTLNREKCEFSKDNIRFLGQLVNQQGVAPDPDKVKAIVEMKLPVNVAEVRRFLGMVNQLGKFSPQLADKTKPLRDLLSLKNEWIWEDSQDKAFKEIKEMLSTAPVLALYEPERESVVSADASSYGIGAVLRQRQPEGEWRPIAYISRSLTDTEQRYAQIEKGSEAHGRVSA